MDIKDLTITLKNCPLPVSLMLKSALIDIPIKYGVGQIILTPEGLTVDFEKVTEQEEFSDIIRAADLLIMSHGYQALKQKMNEKQPGQAG